MQMTHAEDVLQRGADGPAVLVIDDDVDFREFAVTVIEGLGFAALEAMDPRDGIELAASARPAVILLDLQMPGIDGVEVLRSLASGGCRATVMIASGFDNRVLHTAVQVGRELGLTMGAHIEKPVPLDAFEALLRAAVPAHEPRVADLERAIARGELELHYQPKIDLNDDRASPSVEALVRWRHPELGLLMPDRFLPLAEQGGLMDALTRAVLDQALAQVAAWQAQGLAVRVAVNVPPELFQDLELPERIVAQVTEHGVDPDRLVLEVVETTAFSDNQMAMDTLTRLRLRGIGLAIDDFGIGHSSLLLLYRMPFNELKIDRSFVGVMEKDNEARVIVRASIDLAHNLGMHACIEGVETAGALELVRGYGADSVQGYFFSRPLPGDRIAAFFRDRLTPTREPGDDGDGPR